MTTSTSPTKAARLKRGRAERHMSELSDAIKDFIRRNPASIDIKTTGGYPEVVFDTPTVEIPDDISLALGDAVHNLRSALDLLMVDCYRALGKGVSGVKFPFAESSDQLEKIIQKDLLHGGDAICTLIRGMKPYRGGNVALRGLHDLDVSDKHKILIQISRQCLFQMTTTYLYGDDQLIAKVRGNNIGKVTPAKGPVSQMRFDVRTPRNYGEKALVFAGSAPFSGEPILGTVKNLAELVDGIIEAFGRLVTR